MQGTPEANALTLLLKGSTRGGVDPDGPCGGLVALARQLVRQALREEPTLQAAADRLGVGRRTLYRLRDRLDVPEQGHLSADS